MMSGSEPGIMSGRESFAVGIQKNQVHTQQSATPNMRLAFSSDGTAVYKPVISAGSPPYAPAATVSVGGSGGGGDSSNNTNSPGAMVPHGISMSMVGEPMKRKRGRPRKYGPDGTMALALTPSSQGVPTSAGGGSGGNGGGGFSPSSGGPVSPSSSMKKSRGRPPGSGKKQQMAALGSVGVGFTPHVISVQAGEDVSSKIMSFSQHGARAVCILSANGAISNVTLRQAATSGGTVTYEGRFEILSLSGSYLLNEDAGQGRSRTGGLSVSLAGPDGRVLGGGVAGLLTAATPVQVVVGSFIADGRKETKITNHQSEPSSTTPKLPPGGAGGMGTGSPPSRGTLSESSGGPGSPLNQSTGACNNSNNPQGMANMPWK